MYFQRLKDLRNDKELSQADIASYLCTSQQHYSLYERGYREIPVSYIIKLADFYNTTTDYILGRTNDSSPMLHK